MISISRSLNFNLYRSIRLDFLANKRSFSCASALSFNVSTPKWSPMPTDFLVKNLKNTSLQDIIEKTSHNIVSSMYTNIPEKIDQLKTIHSYIHENYEKENINYLLDRRYNFEKYSIYSTHKMIQGALALYLIMFDQAVYWREVSTVVKGLRLDRKDMLIDTWIKTGLVYHRENYTEETLHKIYKFYRHELNNNEFLNFFATCIDKGYKVLNEEDLMYYFNRIVNTNDESLQRVKERSLLTLKNQQSLFETPEFKKNLAKQLPTQYFISCVQYFIYKIDKEKADYKMIKCHADCAQMSFDIKTGRGQKVSLPEILGLMKVQQNSIKGRWFGVEVPESTLLASYKNCLKLLQYIEKKKHRYQYIPFQDFIAESLSIFTKIDLDDEKLDIFQQQFMPIFLNWMLHSTKSENHTIERLATRSKVKKKIWDMFFSSFMAMTNNDTKSLFLFLEKLDASLILMLQKYDLLKHFNYSPTPQFMQKATEYFEHQKTLKEGSFLDLMTENIANEEFLASFYYHVCIPLVQDTVGFRELYYDYCVKRDEYFTVPDRDIIACAFVDYALIRLDSYWLAFFIARTQFYKPLHSQNLANENPVIHFISHPHFINFEIPQQAKNEIFRRYANNISRAIRFSGNAWDGFVITALIEKAYKIKYWLGIKIWYLASYYRYDTIECPSVLDEYVNTDVFNFICKNKLPILQSNPYLVEFARRYELAFPSGKEETVTKQSDFEVATEKTLQKMKLEEDLKEQDELNKQAVLEMARQAWFSQSSNLSGDSKTNVKDMLKKIKLDSVEMFKGEEKNYSEEEEDEDEFGIAKKCDSNGLKGKLSVIEQSNEVVSECFAIYKSLIEHVIEKDVKATARDFASKKDIIESREDRKRREKEKKQRWIQHYKINNHQEIP